MRRALVALGGVVALFGASGCQIFTTAQSPFDPGVRNQGWWADGPANYTQNDSYLADYGGHVTTRNFFSFDLTSACEASSVALQVPRLEEYGSVERYPDSVPYELFDVTTPAATLNNNSGSNEAIWADLGSGTSYGRFQIPYGPASDVLTLPLTQAGVDAFNAARGGFFSVGGTGDSPFDANYALFRGDPPDSTTQQLIVACAD
jgi:hypothetical protein